MLSPQQRTQAIELLSRHFAEQLRHNYNNGDQLKEAMRNGFEGFASYSDQLLLNKLNSIKNGNYEAQNIVTSIAAERFLLD